MTWLDYVLILLVGAAVLFALRSTFRSFKSGKCPGCSGEACGKSGSCCNCNKKENV